MMTQHWNELWRFSPQWEDAMKDNGFDIAPMTPVRIPHTVRELSYHYCNENDYQMVSGYCRDFTPEENWRGKRVLLTFEAVGHVATVWCNGREVAHHGCGYTAFTADLTEALVFGQVNRVAVRCDSRESLDVPPFGKVIDYMTYGGIYRPVTLEVLEQTHLTDVFITAAADGSFTLNTRISGGSPTTVKLSVRKEGRELATFAFLAGATCTGYVPDITPWSPEQPCLYDFKLELMMEGRCTHEKNLAVGFRDIAFTAEGFFLNGRRYPILGLDRHQSWAYQGYAMPASQQILDAELLKKLGCNAVRTSHYPQSQAFIDACDRLGLLVFTEMPGWQYIGGDDWKKQAVENCREMILQYRNHPSIILWGVRINESGDDDAFYARTNALAHRLDPSRPTGGVRCSVFSHCLEDVYTYNDFSHVGHNAGCRHRADVTECHDKGYLICEYGGHMFPTKTFDWECKRLEHALRYAAVASAGAVEPGVAGSFGWCMFDYNTHKDFGSGDRVCHHGVLDMFRNPKLTAAVYQSQRPMEQGEPVLVVSSAMDIGDNAGGVMGDIWAFTNAQSVRLYKNDELIREFYPDRERFPGLAHAPVHIDDVAGCLLEKYEGFTPEEAEACKVCLGYIGKYGLLDIPEPQMQEVRAFLNRRGLTLAQLNDLYGAYIANWGGKSLRYRFDAVYEGQVVKSVTREPVERVFLRAVAHNPHLVDGPTWDCAAISLQAVDQNGNILPYCMEPVSVTVEGPGNVVGPRVIPLRGGQSAVYVATTGQAGTIRVRCAMAGAEPVTLELEASTR